MRVPLFLFFVLSISTIGNAQEKHFHDLRGMEDSSGTTHLFYRLYEETSGCRGINFVDNIIHYNTNTTYEEVFIRNGASSNVYIDGCESESYRTLNFHFIDMDPTKYIESGVGCILDCGYGLSTYAKSYAQTGFTPVRNIEIDSHSNRILISSNYDFEFVDGKTIVLPKEGIESEFYLENNFNTDSFNTFALSIIDISPLQPGVYFFFNSADSNLYKSSDFGSNSSIVDSSDIPWINVQEFIHDVDSLSIYTKTDSDDNQHYFVRSNNTGIKNSWAILSADQDEFFFDINKDNPGIIYLSQNETLLTSSDFGNQFAFFHNFNHNIEGLYKKPNSHLLYVLTSNELIELNIETLEKRVLETLPVSNDFETETPTTITLQQNYPNPFNPNTSISYQLSTNSYITLKIFDALGKEVVVLENGLKSAGNHIASFNANNLSSGIYYYVLDAEDLNQRFIKKMTLIK